LGEINQFVASSRFDSSMRMGHINLILVFQEYVPGADLMTAKIVNLVSHPLVQHKLSLMREKGRSTKSFRELLNEIGMLLCYEVTRDLPLEMVNIETPLAPMKAPQIAGKKLTLAPILRAGVGFLDGMLALVPSARVAHIGLYRDPDTFQAIEYFFKAPHDLSDRTVVLVDPMLATGNSACAAVALLKSRGARDIRFVCLLAAPEGIAQFQKEHPDVPVWTAAVDEKLNDHGYILPGLGDAGDRMFGTK
jgi:uracil phosphoribosyltransferase